MPALSPEQLAISALPPGAAAGEGRPPAVKPQEQLSKEESAVARAAVTAYARQHGLSPDNLGWLFNRQRCLKQTRNEVYRLVAQACPQRTCQQVRQSIKQWLQAGPHLRPVLSRSHAPHCKPSLPVPSTKAQLNPARTALNKGPWDLSEVARMRTLAADQDQRGEARDWVAIGSALNRNHRDVYNEWAGLAGDRQGPWEPAEVALMLRLVADQDLRGEARDWSKVAKVLGRTPHGVKDRWLFTQGQEPGGAAAAEAVGGKRKRHRPMSTREEQRSGRGDDVAGVGSAIAIGTEAGVQGSGHAAVGDSGTAERRRRRRQRQKKQRTEGGPLSMEQATRQRVARHQPDKSNLSPGVIVDKSNAVAGSSPEAIITPPAHVSILRSALLSGAGVAGAPSRVQADLLAASQGSAETKHQQEGRTDLAAATAGEGQGLGEEAKGDDGDRLTVETSRGTRAGGHHDGTQVAAQAPHPGSFAAEEQRDKSHSDQGWLPDKGHSRPGGSGDGEGLKERKTMKKKGPWEPVELVAMRTLVADQDSKGQARDWSKVAKELHRTREDVKAQWASEDNQHELAKTVMLTPEHTAALQAIIQRHLGKQRRKQLGQDGPKKEAVQQAAQVAQQPGQQAGAGQQAEAGAGQQAAHDAVQRAVKWAAREDAQDAARKADRTATQGPVPVATPWTAAEVATLTRRVNKQLKSSSHDKQVEWDRIARRITTHTAEECRTQWHELQSKAGQRWAAGDNRKLLTALLKGSYNQEQQVPWSTLLPGRSGEVTHSQWQLMRDTVTDHQDMAMHQVLEYLAQDYNIPVPPAALAVTAKGAAGGQHKRHCASPIV